MQADALQMPKATAGQTSGPTAPPFRLGGCCRKAQAAFFPLPPTNLALVLTARSATR